MMQSRRHLGYTLDADYGWNNCNELGADKQQENLSYYKQLDITHIGARLAGPEEPPGFFKEMVRVVILKV